MPTNEERREIARKLREVDMDDFSCYAQEHEVIETILGCWIDCEHEGQETNERLADLIEPEPERTDTSRYFRLKVPERKLGYHVTEGGYDVVFDRDHISHVVIRGDGAAYVKVDGSDTVLVYKDEADRLLAWMCGEDIA